MTLGLFLVVTGLLGFSVLGLVWLGLRSKGAKEDGMSQFQDGRVTLRQGTNEVLALWEVQVSGALTEYEVGATAFFSPSGATGVIADHRIGEGVVVVELLSGTPVVGDALLAATTDIFDAGTATAGGAGTLTDSSKNGVWAVNELSGKFLKGKTQATPFWALIVSNSTAGVVTYSPSTVSGVGDTYEVHENQSTAVLGFLRGTPQDWVAAGILPGHYVLLGDLAPAMQIQAVEPKKLTLTVNWALFDLVGSTYGVQKSFTSLGYPLPRVGDRNIPAILSQGFQRIDNDVSFLKKNAFGFGGEQALAINAGVVAPSPLGGWDLVLDTEGGAASDDLTTVVSTDLPVDVTLLLRIADNARVVNVIHQAGGGVGKIALEGGLNLQLNRVGQWLELRPDGLGGWEEFRRGGREKVHIVGTAGEPAFMNGWTSTVALMRFWKDNQGDVHIFGTASKPTVSDSSSVIFSLVPGYIPGTVANNTVTYICSAKVGLQEESNIISISPSGLVAWNRAAGAPAMQDVLVRLDGLHFRAEA